MQATTCMVEEVKADTQRLHPPTPAAENMDIHPWVPTAYYPANFLYPHRARSWAGEMMLSTFTVGLCTSVNSQENPPETYPQSKWVYNSLIEIPFPGDPTWQQINIWKLNSRVGKCIVPWSLPCWNPGRIQIPLSYKVFRNTIGLTSWWLKRHLSALSHPIGYVVNSPDYFARTA